MSARSTALQSETAITIVGADGRLALRRGEAARALGLSDESFARYVAGEIRCVRLGSVQLYPILELLRFLDENARAPLDGR